MFLLDKLWRMNDRISEKSIYFEKRQAINLNPNSVIDLVQTLAALFLLYLPGGEVTQLHQQD